MCLGTFTKERKLHRKIKKKQNISYAKTNKDLSSCKLVMCKFLFFLHLKVTILLKWEMNFEKKK